MGQIKKRIRELSSQSGGKTLARKKAEEWFNSAKKTRSQKEVQATPQRFVPGKIYVFNYKTPKHADILPWWDENPVVLALNSKETNDLGINLNLLPIGIKEELLDFVYDRMEGQIKSRTQGKAANNAISQGQISLSYEGAKAFLKQYGFDFAIRQYIPNLKTNQAVVAYESWADVALCDFIKLNGSSLGKIRYQFREHLKK